MNGRTGTGKTAPVAVVDRPGASRRCEGYERSGDERCGVMDRQDAAGRPEASRGPGVHGQSKALPERQAQPETKALPEVNGAVRGSFRSVLLGWTDPVSGERLTLRMRGEDGLLDSLAPLGFEVLDHGTGAATGDAPGRVLSFRAQRSARPRSLRSARTPGPDHGGGSAAAG